MIFNLIGGGSNAASKFPEFTYTGTYELIDDGIAADDKTQNWRIKFLTSGVLKFTKVVDSIQVFLVGGGGGGGTTRGDGGGGGGGYTKTFSSEVEKNVEYTITVGSGGSVQGDGGSTTAFGQTANGGKAGWGYGNTGDPYRGIGGNGGSGGAGGGGNEDTAGAGGSNGSNGGKASYHAAGTGQGTTTKEFGESNGTLYSGGGGAGKNIHDSAGGGAGGAGGGGKGGSQNIAAVAGTTNLGGGGGGGGADGGGKAGGSGIVVIRNIRTP